MRQYGISAEGTAELIASGLQAIEDSVRGQAGNLFGVQLCLAVDAPSAGRRALDQPSIGRRGVDGATRRQDHAAAGTRRRDIPRAADVDGNGADIELTVRVSSTSITVRNVR